MVATPLEGEGCGGVKVTNEGGEAVFKVKVKHVIVKFDGAHY
jgi:hypothetical protein